MVELFQDLLQEAERHDHDTKKLLDQSTKKNACSTVIFDGFLKTLWLSILLYAVDFRFCPPRPRDHKDEESYIKAQSVPSQLLGTSQVFSKSSVEPRLPNLPATVSIYRNHCILSIILMSAKT